MIHRVSGSSPCLSLKPICYSLSLNFLCSPSCLSWPLLYFKQSSAFFFFFLQVELCISFIWGTLSSVSQFSCSVMSDFLQPHGLQHTRPPCPSSTPGAYSNSCPLSWCCHPTISSSVVPFSSHLQSFTASGSFKWVDSSHQVSQVLEFQLKHQSFQWILNLFPLGWTGWISLQSKGLSRVFSSTTVQKHQFFGAQLSLHSNSHIHTWLLEKP